MNALHPPTAQSAVALTLRNRIARAFGRSAGSYDKHADLQRQVADCLLAMLPVNVHSARILDLGCGTGYCSARLRQRFPASSVLALDLALPMLTVAARQLNAEADQAAANVQMLCADAQALPLKSNSVDLLVSSLALQWCSDPVAVFAGIRRVLRPGGIALVSTMGPATLQALREAWAAVDADSHGNEFLPASQLQQAAATAGLQMQLQRDVVVRHYSSLLALAHEMKALGANVVTSATNALTTPAAFKAAAAAFARLRQQDGIPVEWEIYFLILRKPMESGPP